MFFCQTFESPFSYRFPPLHPHWWSRSLYWWSLRTLFMAPVWFLWFFIIPKCLIKACGHIPTLFCFFWNLQNVQQMGPIKTPYLSQKHFRLTRHNPKAFLKILLLNSRHFGNFQTIEILGSVIHQMFDNIFKRWKIGSMKTRSGF